jgi:hypothetical protein
MLIVIPHSAGEAPRRVSQIRDDVRIALKDTLQAGDLQEREATIVKLAKLYSDICRDPRLARSSVLQKAKTRLWSRLTAIKRDIKKQLAYDSGRPTGAGHFGQSLVAGRSDGVPPDMAIERRGGAAVSDYGPRLVALIERTISPEFWDVNGGPGTIAYYQPLHVLVVRATDDVHGRVGSVIAGLR